MDDIKRRYYYITSLKVSNQVSLVILPKSVNDPSRLIHPISNRRVLFLSTHAKKALDKKKNKKRVAALMHDERRR